MTGKELTDEELQEIAGTYGLYTEQDVENRVSCELLRIGARNEDLEKENAELLCQKNRNKSCYSCANATERCFRNEIGCPCQKYKSYKEENAELKKQQFTLRNERNTFLAQNQQYEEDLIDFNEQLTKAKEIIKTFLGFAEAFGYSPSMDKFISEAEQFLKE